jgi:hypothetical protein
VELAEGERKDAVVKFFVALPDNPEKANAGQAAEAAPPAHDAPVKPAESAILTTVPSAPEPPRSQPVYRTWWLWTGIGVAVAAGTLTAWMLAHDRGNACSGSIYTCVEAK